MRRFKRLLFCAAVIATMGKAQDRITALLEQKLLAGIQAVDTQITGVIGFAAIDLQTGSLIEYHGNAVFPQASSIKIPIMAELFHQVETGKLKWDDRQTLTSADAVGGSGDLQNRLRSGSVTLTTRELMVAMIHGSDNTATNRLIDLAGMDAINAWVRDAGLRQTRLQRRMMDSPAASQDRENLSTPVEMARLAEMLYRGRAVNERASREMVEVLKGVVGDFRKAIPGDVPVASKPGDLTAVHAETGIVFLSKRPFILSVMSTFLDEDKNPLPAITRLVFDHFQRLANSNSYGHKLQ